MGCDPLLIDNKGRKVADPSWEITPLWPDKGIFTYVTKVIPGDSGQYYIYKLVDQNGKFLDGVEFHTYRPLPNGLYVIAKAPVVMPINDAALRSIRQRCRFLFSKKIFEQFTCNIQLISPKS